MNKSVVIIGGGIGGIATALRLATRGYKVTLLEKNETLGGRLNQIKKDGFTFDTGPSFFSMSYEFDELANDCKLTPFRLLPLDPLYTVHLRGHQKPIYLHKNRRLLAEQFSEKDFEKKFDRYLKKCSSLYNDTVDKVVKKNFDSIIHYLATLATVNPVHLPILYRSFWDQITRYFDSDEARQILSLVAFFLGRTPFDTSAVYTLLSYVEFEHDGYYNVDGGMYSVVQKLQQEMEQRGIIVVRNTEIVDVESNNKTITSVIDRNRQRWNADCFVVNADAAVFRGTVLKKKNYSEEKLLKKEWTMGYFTLYVGIDRKLPMLDHHNYFLGSNYAHYVPAVSKNLALSEKPYYYLNILSKYNTTCAPDGCESLFFVCPVPNLIYKPSWEDREEFANSIINDLSERLGIPLEQHIVSKTIYTPLEWQERFNLFKGSGLGLAHSLTQIGAFRPSNIDEDFKNVCYVGASTVPGAGIPMAIISSKLVTERVVAYFKRL